MLKSKNLKKILLGVIISDGNLNKTPNSARLDFYNKQKDYCEYLQNVLNFIPKLNCQYKEKIDLRFNNVKGYRIMTKTHRYFDKLYKIFYVDNKKILSKYVLKRLDYESLAHIWMCDGMLHYMWHPKVNNIQIVGYFCLECFTKEELEDFCKMLKIKFDINARLKKVIWGNGYRVKISGYDLRKFISNILPYILPCFKYKTVLYYRTDECVNEFNNTHEFIKIFTDFNATKDIIQNRRNSV